MQSITIVTKISAAGMSDYKEAFILKGILTSKHLKPCQNFMQNEIIINLFKKINIHNRSKV